MERILSPEERIRRAEEIYYRRKIMEGNNNYARVNVSNTKKDFTMLKKIILKILICMVIYSIFYMIKTTDYIFSESVINKTKEILNYDINIPKLYNKAKDYINTITNKDLQDKETSIEEKEDVIVEEKEQEETELESLQESIQGVGGETVLQEQEEALLTQMEQDAKYIKATKSLILPLRGEITSRFGPRDSNNPIVSKTHTGIDIAANEGTIFYSSMEGTVEDVSSIRRTWKSYSN